MTNDNALRTPYTADTTRTQIHLVYSAAWQIAPPKKPLASARFTPQVVPHTAPRAPRSRSRETFLLAAAAIATPSIWVGHALLHVMHVL